MEYTGIKEKDNEIASVDHILFTHNTNCTWFVTNANDSSFSACL